jgi:lipid-A-disaccharide synthase
MPAVDILILSNGPGELTTWVRPVVRSLREELGTDRSQVRISVILSPCPHATGKEVEIANSYGEVDRVQAAEHFFRFLLLGKTAEDWDWRDRGVVLFLGGDRFFAVAIAKRLGYRSVIYVEWEANWVAWSDRFAVMKPETVTKVPQKYRHKFTVVGDLMADVGRGREGEGERGREGEEGEVKIPNSDELIGLLPGSKAAKLAQGVPLILASAERIQAVRPQTRFAIPVAPTVDLPTLAKFANREQNPVIEVVQGTTAELIMPEVAKSDRPILKTANGLEVELWTEFPAYELLSRCCLCLTTVGANTAELGALAVPMIVLLPSNQLDAMRSWDGLPGLLANLPALGAPLSKAINWLADKLLADKLFAWPNIWAQAAIVPELRGKLYPLDVAKFTLDLLADTEQLTAMRDRLRCVRGEPGAAQKLARLVAEEISI